jgi:hypothetical protein
MCKDMQEYPWNTVELGQPPTTTNPGLSLSPASFLLGPAGCSLGASLTFLDLLSILLAGCRAGVIPFVFV